MSYFLTLTVSLMVYGLLLSNPLQAQPQLPTIVYRADVLPPETVFAQGFSRSGTFLSLLDHALGHSCDATAPAQRSAWVSTTADRQVATRFIYDQLRSGNFPQAALNGASGMWLYAIRTDYTFLDVTNIFHQVIQAGANHRSGYSAQQAAMLQNRLVTTSALRRTEVVARRILPTEIISAGLAVYNPNAPAGRQISFAPGTVADNPAYESLSDPNNAMNNNVANLTALVPPDSIEMYDRFAGSCLLACDSGATRAERKRRSTSQGVLNCAALPSAAHALIGSEP